MKRNRKDRQEENGRVEFKRQRKEEEKNHQ